VTCNELIGLKSGATSDSEKPKQVRGVISGVSIDITEDELQYCENTEESKATKAICLNKRVNGGKAQTSTILLIFEGEILPEHVTFGFTWFCPRAYIATPTRCAKCQCYGHIFRFCRGKETCPRCAGNHSFAACNNKDEPKCSNRNERHSAAY